MSQSTPQKSLNNKNIYVHPYSRLSLSPVKSSLIIKYRSQLSKVPLSAVKILFSLRKSLSIVKRSLSSVENTLSSVKCQNYVLSCNKFFPKIKTNFEPMSSLYYSLKNSKTQTTGNTALHTKSRIAKISNIIRRMKWL